MPEVLMCFQVDPRNTTGRLRGRLGLPEVSYWEWFKVGLLGLLISAVSTAVIGGTFWWIIK
jgi:hypothetical protein